MLGVSSSPRNENYRRQEQGVNGSREGPGKAGGIFCVAISCSRGWSQKWQGEKFMWDRGKPSAFSLSMSRLLSPKSSILEPLNSDGLQPQLICVWSPVIFLAGKDSNPIISKYNLIFNLLRKIEGKIRSGQRRMKWLASLTQWTWTWTLQDGVEDRGTWWSIVHRVIKRWTWLRDWTTILLALLSVLSLQINFPTFSPFP